LYSFRDTIDSPMPDLRSKNSVNALEMINKIKNKISSGKHLRNKNYYIFNNYKILKY